MAFPALLCGGLISLQISTSYHASFPFVSTVVMSLMLCLFATRNLPCRTCATGRWPSPPAQRRCSCARYCRGQGWRCLSRFSPRTCQKNCQHQQAVCLSVWLRVAQPTDTATALKSRDPSPLQSAFLARTLIDISLICNSTSSLTAPELANQPSLSVSGGQECFNSPYGTKFFDEYAETIPGPTTEALGSAAEEHKVRRGSCSLMFLFCCSIMLLLYSNVAQYKILLALCAQLLCERRASHTCGSDIRYIS